MPVHDIIPALDPIPLPAPYWLLKLLLIVTFALHLLAMNAMLGGMVLALASRWGNREFAGRMFTDVATKLPSLLPATVTLAVAALLFLQVIYGQFFYTSSVIIAWPWFLILLLLMLAYYGLYYTSAQAHREPGAGHGLLLGSFVLIAAIGFLLSNNLTLSQTPGRWASKYFANPGGWNLNLTEPTLFPRYLHFFTAAIAVGALMLMLIASWKRDAGPEYRRYLFRFGGRAFQYATLAQFATGFAFLVSLGTQRLLLFFGGNFAATSLLACAVAAAIAAVLLVGRALANEDYRLGAWAGPGITAVVVLAMVIIRDILRDDYLKPYFHPDRFIVQTQWTVLPLFLAIFLGGVALWVVMLWRYPFTAAAKAEASRPGESA